MNISGGIFFLHEEIQWQTLLSCQTPFCRTGIQLLSLIRQIYHGLFAGRFNRYCHTTNIMIGHNKVEAIIYEAIFLQVQHASKNRKLE